MNPEQASVEPREEFFDNAPTGVEVEDVGAAARERRAWDPGKIRVVTKPYSLRQLIDLIDGGGLDLTPDFQRLAGWTATQKSQLVESVLLGIPLPAFYFHQDPEGTLHVVDGVARLTVLHRFVKGDSPLEGLGYLGELSGKSFDALETALKRRFQQTQLTVNVIEPQTPDEVKFDLFRRLNTGGSPLTAQEIRHCMSGKPSRELLGRLTALESFRDATGGALTDERRMVDRELALRFCAFRIALDDYPQLPGLDEFLLDFTRRIDGAPASKPALGPEALETLAADFDRAMRSAKAAFGDAAFRKFPASATRPGPINRALFESWAVALADHEPEALAPRAAELTAAARAMLDAPDYLAAISSATGEPERVALRFARARAAVRGEAA